MSILIIARFTLPGLHHWPDAPDRRAYLRSPHRHLFEVEVEHPLHRADREIEFHDLAESARIAFHRLGVTYHSESTLVDFGARSCEMLADALGLALAHEGYWPSRIVVSEDGENDGIWEAEK